MKIITSIGGILIESDDGTSWLLVKDDKRGKELIITSPQKPISMSTKDEDYDRLVATKSAWPDHRGIRIRRAKK